MEQRKLYEFKVATQCTTYNHAPYIEDTLNGFAIQQVSFPVVYIVVDDNSNDGTRDVIYKWAESNLVNNEEGISYKKRMSYGDLIYARHKNNNNVFFVMILLFENHYQNGKEYLKFEYINEWCDKAEYIAICEGDDYWSNPQKLQLQVEVLDKAPSYVLCFTNYSILHTNGIIEKAVITDLPLDDDYSEVLITKGNKVATLTVLIKQEAYKDVPRLSFHNKWKMGDLPLWIELSQLGLFKYIPEVTAVYRKLNFSASHNTNIYRRLDFIRNTYEIKRYYADYYRKNIDSVFFDTKMYEALLNEAFVSKDSSSSRELYREAKSKKISSFDMWKTYVLTVYKNNPLVLCYLFLRKLFK